MAMIAISQPWRQLPPPNRVQSKVRVNSSQWGNGSPRLTGWRFGPIASRRRRKPSLRRSRASIGREKNARLVHAARRNHRRKDDPHPGASTAGAAAVCRVGRGGLSAVMMLRIVRPSISREATEGSLDKLVDQTVASWNQIACWLQQLARLRQPHELHHPSQLGSFIRRSRS